MMWVTHPCTVMLPSPYRLARAASLLTSVIPTPPYTLTHLRSLSNISQGVLSFRVTHLYILRFHTPVFTLIHVRILSFIHVLTCPSFPLTHPDSHTPVIHFHTPVSIRINRILYESGQHYLSSVFTLTPVFIHAHLPSFSPFIIYILYYILLCLYLVLSLPFIFHYQTPFSGLVFTWVIGLQIWITKFIMKSIDATTMFYIYFVNCKIRK